MQITFYRRVAVDPNVARCWAVCRFLPRELLLLGEHDTGSLKATLSFRKILLAPRKNPATYDLPCPDVSRHYVPDHITPLDAECKSKNPLSIRPRVCGTPLTQQISVVD